jgi:hypothetical protein
MRRLTLALFAIGAIVGGGLVAAGTAAPGSLDFNRSRDAPQAPALRALPSADTLPNKAVTTRKSAKVPQDEQCPPQWWDLGYWFDAHFDIGMGDESDGDLDPDCDY